MVRASRFVLFSSRLMERIAIDTIGPIGEDIDIKYIIFLIFHALHRIIYFAFRHGHRRSMASHVWVKRTS